MLSPRELAAKLTIHILAAVAEHETLCPVPANASRQSDRRRSPGLKRLANHVAQPLAVKLSDAQMPEHIHKTCGRIAAN
jgi:hypothetical protein